MFRYTFFALRITHKEITPPTSLEMRFLVNNTSAKQTSARCFGNKRLELLYSFATFKQTNQFSPKIRKWFGSLSESYVKLSVRYQCSRDVYLSTPSTIFIVKIVP